LHFLSPTQQAIVVGPEPTGFALVRVLQKDLPLEWAGPEGNAGFQ